MRICALSDTHTKHEQVVVPPCDLLIHAGDFTFRGEFFEVRDFVEWFGAQTQAKHRVLIAGNHELSFDPNQSRFRPSIYELVRNRSTFTYLENSSVVVEGLKIYGTPWTPFFHDWAFNGWRDEDAPYNRGRSLREIYDGIPEDTNILVCHGPPYGILDENLEGENVGSKELLARIGQLPDLSLVVMGHIHEARGVEKHGGVTFINASNLDRDYRICKPATVIDL